MQVPFWLHAGKDNVYGLLTECAYARTYIRTHMYVLAPLGTGFNIAPTRLHTYMYVHMYVIAYMYARLTKL